MTEESQTEESLTEESQKVVYVFPTGELSRMQILYVNTIMTEVSSEEFTITIGSGSGAWNPPFPHHKEKLGFILDPERSSEHVLLQVKPLLRFAISPQRMKLLIEDLQEKYEQYLTLMD